MSENWTAEELEAAVQAYIDMLKKQSEGQAFVKKAYYLALAKQFGRSDKAFEYRMQNISYVYSLMGRRWVNGLKPAKNVGTRVAIELEALIHRAEGQTFSEVVEFQSSINALKNERIIPKPAGSRNPQRKNTTVTEYCRDPAIVAWVLNEAKGSCEVCNHEAPFVKEDGSRFLEVHHLRRLADGGSDTASNAIAVCPNCHREPPHRRPISHPVSATLASGGSFRYCLGHLILKLVC